MVGISWFPQMRSLPITFDIRVVVRMSDRCHSCSPRNQISGDKLTIHFGGVIWCIRDVCMREEGIRSYFLQFPTLSLLRIGHYFFSSWWNNTIIYTQPSSPACLMVTPPAIHRSSWDRPTPHKTFPTNSSQRNTIVGQNMLTYKPYCTRRSDRNTTGGQMYIHILQYILVQALSCQALGQKRNGSPKCAM